MALPDYAALMQPILDEAAAVEGTISDTQLIAALAARFGLSDDEVASTLAVGGQTVLAHRIDWAVTYLQRAGLIELVPGGLRLTGRGREAVGGKPPAERAGATESGFGEPEQEPFAAAPLTPEEQIAQCWQTLHDKLKADLLARIHACKPAAFERLVIDLLLKLGYADNRAELAKQVGRSGDGGIDGIIRQDRLGLDAVHIQAKRLKPGTAVPIAAVRDFIGALDARKATKGVFAATGRFPASAVDFINASSKSVVLIDGEELAELMIRNGVGVTTRAVYEIKWIDQAYFLR